MKHIFYLHSNICVIAVFHAVSQLIDKGEKVVIVSERNTRFPDLSDQLLFYDIEPIIDKYRRNTNSKLKQLINYRFELIPRYNSFAKDVINNEDFILYIPSYSMYTILPFLRNVHCRGYYFIEEGTMSYMSQESLRRRYLKRRYLNGRMFLDLIGAGETPDYKITRKFKGCICISEEAFPWCRENKILTNVDCYFSILSDGDEDIDSLIITNYLREDKQLIINAFKLIIDTLCANNRNAKIGIKFHPTAYAYEAQKIKDILSAIRDDYKFLDFTLLPSSYSVEGLMYKRHINVYSVFGMSSLLLYSLMLKSRSFQLTYKNDEIMLNEIPGIQDYLAVVNA